MKKILFIAFLGVCAYAALPYWNVYTMSQGIEAGDPKVLENKVDWDRVRGAMGDDIKASMMAQAGSDPLAGAMANTLGGAMVDGMVDSFVTPANAADIIRQSDVQDPWAHISWAFFTAVNEFKVTLSETETGGDTAADLYFERQGLQWQLVRIKLPDDVLSGLNS
ncbi:DUF2939 domain-containing protein [Parasulfitobacter algicola]|uniref:DUF2939 domain-containing protein n=1 Tax=Parasulfitobacter algicola TaxID=2614809 RepID=A0ABX2IZ26_9RHOB|nr:DUF2939 domain-containing protein [Sulfitobacter algicola]NSX55941.1 DUF2939 domain-containing protein [Sulfitobacter algicola]